MNKHLDFLTKKNEQLDNLQQRLEELEGKKMDEAIWSNGWVSYDKEIKTVQTDNTYLEKELREFSRQLNTGYIITN
ncbi:hypothetical protein [Pontibacter beigongshangensis]|uniref:hypothetical protein n=1 Tax=Pontibacter beigongshangensis TaxID=2574733 RepID=UPI00164F3B3A|nr:hypothetical protein [Pontibacter beigongshangensis]